MARKRVAAAAPDPSREIVVKIGTPSTQSALDLDVHYNENESSEDTDSDSDSDSESDSESEEDDDDDENESSDSSSASDDSVHEQPLTNQRSSTRERTRDNVLPAAPFYGRNRAGTIHLPHPGALPCEIFAHYRANHAWHGTNDSSKLKRMVRHYSPHEILIYASAFLLNGAPHTSLRAGCAVLTETIRDEHHPPECKGFLLERTGPCGKIANSHAQKRADLRAVVAALEYQIWGSEGWKTVTIATNSGWVHNGMTRFIEK